MEENKEETQLIETKEGFSRVSMEQDDSNSDQLDKALVDAPEPKLLANKFKSSEELEKAYIELQSKFSKGEKAPEAVKEDGPKGQEANLKNTFNTAFQEYETTGEVSDEAKQAFVDMGIPESVVDNYIANAQASQILQKNDVLDSVGGQQAFDEISNWSVLNLKQDEIDGFNAIIESGDINQIKLTLGNLKARMGSSKFVTPDVKGGHSEGSFESKGAMVAAMNDKRYSTDSAYRNQVQRKLARSSNL